MRSAVNVESFVEKGDSDRVIRFINGAPITIPSHSSEAMSHDVERYCAFKQNCFHESERANDKSLTSLQKARDTRVKLLDSLDKLVTVVHLLTNTAWGESVPIRFLSCRQSAPQRERLAVSGDRDVVGSLTNELVDIHAAVAAQWNNYHITKQFVKKLREAHAVTEMRMLSNRILPCVELLPSTWEKVSNSVAVITLEGTNPTLKADTMLETIMRNKFTLNIPLINNPLNSERHVVEEMDETRRVQLSSLDLQIVQLLQGIEHPMCCMDHRFSKILVSRSPMDFSVSYGVTSAKGEAPRTVAISLGEISSDCDFALVKALRLKFIGLLGSPCRDPGKALSDYLASEIHSRMI